jgi:drug/metabolite transporter (DMT)-like permease
MWKKHWYWILASGACLSVHFSAWVLSLQMTTMAHSLLFVSAGSIIIVAIQLLSCRRVSPLTIVGAVIGFLGIAVVAFAPFTDLSGSIAGDFIALLAAFAVLGYLKIGENLRKQNDIPLFPYLVAVNGTAATL